MRIWLIKIGEPWPTDEVSPRLSRTGVMAQQYARAGDDVIWVSDVFDHNRKTQRFDRATTLTPEAGLTIVGLRGPGYPRNVCIERFAHHKAIAEAFRNRAPVLPRPDVIVVSAVPLELLLESVRYGREQGIPVVTDIRDMWPDAWLDVIPQFLRPVGRLAIYRYVRMLREAMRNATAICGLSQGALDWGLRHAGRVQGPLDCVLPLAYAPPAMTDDAIAEAECFWSKLGIEKTPDRINVCFIGTFTKRVEFSTVIKAAQTADPALRRAYRFIFCGSGELEQKLKNDTKDLDCFLFPGWLNATQLVVLARRAQIGLLPYPSDADFRRSLPNKVFDYLNGGLPILTCLTGAVETLVRNSVCGWMYRNGDPDSLKRVLHSLATDPAAIAMAARNSSDSAGKYDAQTVYGDYRQLLEQIVSAGGSG